jgi:hypothetical protein
MGDIVYLYSPAVKVRVSSKFRGPRALPFRVAARKSQLNCAIVNQQGKDFVVHVKRLKKAYDQMIWQEKAQDARKARTKRQKPEEEDEGMILSPGSIPFRAPQVENPTRSK